MAGAGAARDPKVWKRLLPARALLLSEPTVFGLHGEAVLRAMRAAKVQAAVHLFPTGEAAKDWARVAEAVGAMVKNGLGRDAAVVALGGGALTDAAGFAAAIYLRGIPWVSVPTTLLGQVDSGIGGKTAVNLPEGKNLLGAFHQPKAVVCDTAFLDGLPERELLSGLAEALKIALTFDPPFWRSLLNSWPPRDLAPVIKKAAGWKLKIVAQDERETRGRRELLNFGHTLGHAVESAAGYGALRHGEAVVWGMRAALRLSPRFSGRDEALDFLASISAPLPPGLKAEDLVERCRRDKKARGGKVRFILLRGVGRPYAAPVPDAKILAAAKELLDAR